MSVAVVFCSRTYSEAEMWMGAADARALTLSAFYQGLSHRPTCASLLCACPRIAAIMDFLLKKTSSKHLQWFSSLQPLSLPILWVRYTPLIKYVESIHTRFSGILGSLSYRLLNVQVQLNPARPFWQKLPETWEMPWLFSSIPQTSFCNLMQGKTALPRKNIISSLGTACCSTWSRSYPQKN